MKKPTDKMRPMCRHCFEFIEVQHRLDDKVRILNVDGSDHKCRGSGAAVTTVEESVRPAVRSTDPDTSREAWDGTKEKASALRIRIALWLKDQGSRGGTISEIARALGYEAARDSVSPRMTELLTAGIVTRGTKRRVPWPGLGSQMVWTHIDCS